MSEPLKPRIDFETELKAPVEPVLRPAQAFDEMMSGRFIPVSAETDEQQEEGEAEAVLSRALKPRRSLWSKMVRLGVAVLGISVVAQGVQWVHHARRRAGADGTDAAIRWQWNRHRRIR